MIIIYECHTYSSIELLPSVVTAQNEVDVPAAAVVKGNLIQNVIFFTPGLMQKTNRNWVVYTSNKSNHELEI